MSDLREALKLAQRMCREALPKFNWGASSLDANAIDLLNRAPIAIDAALSAEPAQPMQFEPNIYGHGEPPRDPAWPAQEMTDERIRRLLCLRIGGPLAYMDDGEASLAEHGISIDFLREPAADIEAKVRALNVARAVIAADSRPPEITDEQIDKIANESGWPPSLVAKPIQAKLREFARAVEALVRGKT